MVNVLDDFSKEQFDALGKTRDLYRLGSGPAVIVIAEMPGITPNVAAFGRKVAAIGCTAVLPHLFGEPGAGTSVSTVLKSIGPACVSREFSAWALKRTSPVTVWLRSLAAHEHERCGGPGVGAVGMCFTGGFAAGHDDRRHGGGAGAEPTLAAVPDHEEAQGGHRDLRRGPGQGEGPRGGRGVRAGTALQRGPVLHRRPASRPCDASSASGFIAVELDSSPGNPHGHTKNAHSVLTEHLDDREGTPTRAALDQVLAFFAERLQVASTP